MNLQGLLIRELNTLGFIYYPSVKRSMRKAQSTDFYSTTIVELSENGDCTVILSTLTGSNESNKSSNEVRQFNLKSNASINDVTDFITSFIKPGIAQHKYVA
ncbi:MAG: hypothetical protein ACRC6R_02585 [Bacteroidales bacterium]